ncbi:hypothetical protein RISK_001016 [Rhodopirellula islandica]|uniref:Uncharacterized protein n=1 Tax=Rhodopirellula islandica TaxID=595434 RepID=A0A0J1BL07_RHOIS|nr:hypothetical protein RISK_001016 [Rhodopirellula islandica]
MGRLDRRSQSAKMRFEAARKRRMHPLWQGQLAPVHWRTKFTTKEMKDV